MVLYRDVDLTEEVRPLTGDEGSHVAYDGIGADTFDKLLAALKPRGTIVVFGAASGPVPPVDPMRLLQAGSVHLTRTTILHFIATRHELLHRATQVLQAVADGTLTVQTGARFPFTEAAQAHNLLESGRGPAS